MRVHALVFVLVLVRGALHRTLGRDATAAVTDERWALPAGRPLGKISFSSMDHFGGADTLTGAQVSSLNDGGRQTEAEEKQ